jgi:hypothetical protein
MSSELEGDSAMVMNLESFGVDGAGYDETETEPSSAKFDKPAVKIMFQVTGIVRFLLERGLRFRNLQCTGTDPPGKTRPFPAIS